MKRRMILVRLFTPIATLLVVGAAPGWARADETPAPVSSANETPPTAFAALVRAAAAYEYGDMVQVVDAARPVAEGTLPSSAEQRARALRLLGIGLFLTNRALGADNAFAELLRVDPSARLDPTTTRPEVVAFFENIRHQHVARERAASRHFIWNLLPPVGQFRNGDALKGWIVGGLEFASIATIVRTDDNRYVVTSSHNLLPIILLFALLFVLMAALWIIRARLFHKRARHKSETASPERKATTNQTSSHDKPTE